nr:MAG TPA: hypothetical protein [Caudoviricetes sp.]
MCWRRTGLLPMMRRLGLKRKRMSIGNVGERNGMYRNLDECLSQVYKISSVMIEPRGNTASVISHIQGDCPSSSGLTQAEWHANAAMIRSQVSGCLNSPLLVAVVECEYGKLDGLLIIAGVLVAKKICDDVYLAADMLRHIYSEMPKRVAIMDKYDLHDMTFQRKRDRICKHLAAWEQEARFKLQTCFKERKIID